MLKYMMTIEGFWTLVAIGVAYASIVWLGSEPAWLFIK